MNTLVKQISVDFLYLDLETCTRCRATDATLREAIELTNPALAAVGATVEVTKTHVADADQARQVGFISSPTIRVDGQDIAGELVESPCDSCSDGCACGGGIDCGDWVYRGQRSTEPPVGLIVGALMRAAAGPGGRGTDPADQPAPDDLPENLRRYFIPAEQLEQSGRCCDDTTLDTCCAAGDKAACCGADLELQLCGCQS
ncbi:MAG: DUF2703 domain-containing protein [Propionibacteriaceae bacterium]